MYNFFNREISSSFHLLCSILPLPTPAPPLCLLLFFLFFFCPPPPYSLLKFCLAKTRCPFLAQSSEREREWWRDGGEWEGKNTHTHTQEPAPIVGSTLPPPPPPPLWCLYAKHSSCVADEGTRQASRYFLASASCNNPLQIWGVFLAAKSSVSTFSGISNSFVH